MYKRMLLAALIALMIVGTGCRKNSDTPTEPSESVIPGTTETGAAEETAESTGAAGETEISETAIQSQEQETQASEPEAQVSATKPQTSETKPQKPDQNNQSSGQGTQKPSQGNQPSNQETQPDIQETEPPKVDVSLGVVGSDDDSNLDDVVPDIPDSEVNDDPVPTEKPENNDQEDSPAVDKNFDLTELDYEGFHALSGEDQKTIINMFGSTEDFMKWYKAVEAVYQAEHPEIEIGGEINGWELGE